MPSLESDPIRPSRAARGRPGFTLIELLFVLLITGVLAGIGVPRVMAAVSSSSVSNAARVIAGDLRFAISLASRQGHPVRFEVDEGDMGIRIVDSVDGTELHWRPFGPGSELPVGSLTADAGDVTMYPNRTVSGEITITVAAAGRTAQVNMTPAGFVRFGQP